MTCFIQCCLVHLIELNGPVSQKLPFLAYINGTLFQFSLTNHIELYVMILVFLPVGLWMEEWLPVLLGSLWCIRRIIVHLHHVVINVKLSSRWLLWPVKVYYT